MNPKIPQRVGYSNGMVAYSHIICIYSAAPFVSGFIDTIELSLRSRTKHLLSACRALPLDP